MDIKPERPASDPTRCPRCRGCGAIADSDDGEPWLDWLELPVQSAAAVIYGLVKPIPCPQCDGRGTVEPPAPRTSEWIEVSAFSNVQISDGVMTVDIEIPEGVTPEEAIARVQAAWQAAITGPRDSVEPEPEGTHGPHCL